ncbi:MAG: preprotein translocase subunit SecE [Candidatus Marinimicrobia bacterium]|nr:preprotein translocase subunit SecE [Candidatus Neomarinimicrobiota bacterium]
MELPFKSKAMPLLFLQEIRTELSKVSWPSKQQATRLTLIVIAATVVAALFLGAFDLYFTKLTELVIR